MKKIISVFLLVIPISLFSLVYRESLISSFLKQKESLVGDPVWISSIDILKNQLMGPQSMPAIVCITHSSLPKTTDLRSLLDAVKQRLEGKAHVFCIDAQNEQLIPFILQVKQQVGMEHMPLPAFVFFEKSSIVLPIHAGLCSQDSLVHTTCKRFGISLEKKP